MDVQFLPGQIINLTPTIKKITLHLGDFIFINYICV